MATSSKDGARDALSLALESQPDMIKEVKASTKCLRALAERSAKRDGEKRRLS